MKNELKFLLSGIGENDCRKNLMWLKCVVKDRKLTMIAANGFLIKRIIMDYNIKDCEFYIDREAIFNALKFSKKYKIELKKTHLAIRNIETYKKSIIIKYKPYKFEYPCLKHLTDAKYNNKSTKSIYLSNYFLKSALLNTPDQYCFIKMSTTKHDLSPVKIEYMGAALGSVYESFLMPVDADW